MRRLLILIFLLFTPGFVAHAAEETSPDQRFLEELLGRGLFRLAELHCRERLSAENLSQGVQAELTLELIRVLQERSLAAPGPEKKALEDQAREIYEEFRKKNPDCPWQLAVDFQYAVGLLAQARRAEMEAHFALEPEEGLQAAREILREAIRRFLEIDARREEQTLKLAQESKTSGLKPEKGGKSGKKGAKPTSEPRDYSRFSGDGLSLFELESLKNNVQFQLLLAYELQAACYPEDSLDRLNALKEAQSRARNLTMVPSSSRLYWNARIEELRIFRLQKDFEGARKRWELLVKQSDTMTENVRLEFLAERIRLALAEGKTDAALGIVKNDLHPEIIGKNGELDCAILELWLAQWDAAMKANSGDVAKLRDETIGILNEIRKKSTPWWARRAEVLFNGMFKKAAGNQNLPFLKMAAENACANFDADAVHACERLWDAAQAEQNEEMALHAGELAASFLYKSGKKAEAADWFRRLAVTFPENPQSVQNHALAVGVTAEVVSQELQNAGGKFSDQLNGKLDQYQALLLEHFQLFGKTDPEILETLRKLEAVTRIRQNFAECVDVSMILVQNTPVTDPKYAETEAACFETWKKYLTQLKKSGSADYRRALLTAVRWVETLEESEALAETRAKNCFFLLCALDGLNTESETKDPKILQAETRLFTAMKNHLDAFPPEIRDEVEQIGTYAMIQAGNPQEAFPFYEKIAQKFPNRLEVQLTWGRLLAEKALAENDPARKKAALAQWRQIEKHTENLTSDWYEAKYWVIRFLMEVGETKQAERVLRTFKTLHPDLGGEKWKGKFEELEGTHH